MVPSSPSSRKIMEHKASIVVMGESGVGKTCFCDVFFGGKPFLFYDVTTPESRRRTVSIDDESWSLDLMDLDSTVLSGANTNPTMTHTFFEMSLQKANGIVLIYDVTSSESFSKLTDEAYTFVWRSRSGDSSDGEIYPAGRRRFGCVLVGNKADIARTMPGSRQVSKDMAEQWAQSQGFIHFEVDSKDRMEVENAVEALVRSIKRARRWDEKDLEANKNRPRSDNAKEKTSIGSRMKQLLKSPK